MGVGAPLGSQIGEISHDLQGRKEGGLGRIVFKASHMDLYDCTALKCRTIEQMQKGGAQGSEQRELLWNYI